MKITILTHRCLWGETYLFDFEMKENTDKIWARDMIDKLYRKRYFDPEKAKGELYFEEIPKPNTFPKFNNEIKFKVKWNKGYIYNPKIKEIQWNSKGWEYQLKNIGHVYSFQSEKLLIKI